MCLKSVVIPWGNQVAGGRPWVWQQDSKPAHKSKETQAWLQKECYDFCTLLSLTPLLHRPEPAGLLRLVIRREHHQHDLPQHQSQPDRRHPPSISRAPAGVEKFPGLPFNSNSSIQHYSFVRTQLNNFKYCYVSLTISIKYQSFVCTQLNDQTVLFQTIQFNIKSFVYTQF